MKKGDLVICFNKFTKFESIGYIQMVCSNDNFVIYTFKDAGSGIWQKSYIKFLTNFDNVLVDNMEKKL
tara:strand:+ start:1547 stop:1750 length:204 start_codon:yes stop_codon:yes gene_type:complete